ncbi:MAG: tRNA 4-thiouridine(8) synthase ThiI [Candidatus Marinimicrobia bacterium]|nr:tRNA 4-thiouridine(8) synthase ThiI [Candidatus Neomarinimicrobiota bacterium]|tara:strand:+ start:11484 stop:12668 length:1185 start_codon:yes stop_codon:yes gene_type:complete
MLNKTPQFSALIHYSEIGLKKNNRKFFEQQFIQNISRHLIDLEHTKVRLVSARIIVEGINPMQWDALKQRLNNVMGLSSATLMMKINSDIDSMKLAIDYLIQDTIFDSFRLTTKRHYKEFQKTSIELNIELGSYIQQKTNKKVQLSNADLNIIIEVLKNKTYIGYKKIIGFAGLPACSQEKAISLLSSGIDSPVSSFEMIKRGVNLSFIHFHSYPAISRQSIENVKELVQVLTRYQLQSTLYCVPLLNIQEKIMESIPDKFWVIFFRRAMLTITNKLAEQTNQVAIITGDNIGQVASQTLSNIRAISEVSSLPIIRPLSGMNKNDIVNRAKQIGTYDISVKPYQDCCSYFVPLHPETKAKMDEVLAIDSMLNLDQEYDEVFNNIEKHKIKFVGE